MSLPTCATFLTHTLCPQCQEPHTLQDHALADASGWLSPTITIRQGAFIPHDPSSDSMMSANILKFNRQFYA